ncbi:MAG: DUF4148 domain-containing protein [Haliea sp.]|nr:MAG: DUF4148 domain-containing protein [Haliea sp.]
MNTTRLLTIAAFSAFAAFGAHADEADASQYGVKVQSTRAAAEVRAEAMNPVRISNGGTGYIGLTNSATTSAAVKAQGAQSARAGQTSKGEIGLM